MTASSSADGADPNTQAWKRILASAGQPSVLAADVDDWEPLPASEATWLTRTPLPDGWQTIATADDSAVPLRVAGFVADGGSGWAARQALSAFRFTGWPAPDVLYSNNDRALRALSAAQIRTDYVILPEWPGLAGVDSEGFVETDGHLFRVCYRTYVRGSDQPHQGLVVEEISAVDWQALFRFGSGLGAMTRAAKDAFTARVGVTAEDMAVAVAAHGDRIRAEAARAAARGPVLSDEQRRFLWHALAMWGGVASWLPLPITALGYTDWAAFDADVARMRERLDDADPRFSALDWTRILLLAEISFGSDLLGAGVEFDIVTPWRDPEALRVLRSIQRALAGTANASLLFPTAGRRNERRELNPSDVATREP